MRYLFLAACLLFSLPAYADPIIGETSTYAREQGLDSLYFYVSSGDGQGQIEYICTAFPNQASSAEKWQIRKFTYDSSNRVSTIRWADGTSRFIKVCDDRATYDYTP